MKLIFSHGSTRATVQRNLRPNRPTAILTIEGGDTIEGDTAVTAKIVEILGVGTDIVNDIIIVAQDDIFGDMPGDAHRTFMKVGPWFGEMVLPKNQGSATAEFVKIRVRDFSGTQ